MNCELYAGIVKKNTIHFLKTNWKPETILST